MKLLRWSLCWLGLLLSVASAPAAETTSEPDLSAELPRIPPHEPADAMKTFKVQPGFRLEQVAAEPNVADPIALAFDANARMYVVEMLDYSEQDKEALGVIRLLEDVDQDGRFEKSTVFAEHLSWPTAITCYDGGIFVGAAPDIWYLKDTDGDGKADVRRKIFTGFSRTNVQGLLNSLTWGLDNRIHGASGTVGGEIRPADDAKAQPIGVRGRDFAFDPRTLKFEATTGGGQYGMSFDDWGHKFVCSNSDHLQQVMFDDRYIARNPYLTVPSPRVSIAADGRQAEIYRASPVEPWRIVRTRLRIAGVVPGMVEQGGRISGYFTGASGLCIYRGNAFPQSQHGIAVVGEACGGLVHRKTLTLDGLQYVGQRIDKESEWVASSDIWFRPVQFFNAPDGALYIADMYREVIEHPASLPPMIKKHLDLTSGRDRGRVYRVVPDGFRQPKLPRLADASTAELVATLAHSNGWHRETAARLLFERQDKAAVAPLAELARAGSSPLAQMHALYALDGMRAITPEIIVTALDDKSPRVREPAIRLSEGVLANSPMVGTKLCSLVGDADLQVRYQLAFTLGYVSGPQRTQALAELIRRDGANPWMQLAIFSSLSQGAGEVFKSLAEDSSFRSSATARPVLLGLANLLGLSGSKASPSDISAVFATVEALPDSESALAGAIVRSFSDGLAKRGGSLGEVLKSHGGKKAQGLLDGLLASARTTAANADKPVGQRVDAISTLVLDPSLDLPAAFAPLLENRQSPEVQQAAVTALSRFRKPAVAEILLEAWPTMSPQLRLLATEALFARAERLSALLDAVEKRSFAATEIEPARVQSLVSSYPDAKLRERAARLLKDVKLGRRQDVIEAYRPVLKLAGDPARGKVAFQKTCTACHRAENVGHEIGPNLVTIKNRGAEFILLNVLDPSREVNPQYVNYVAVTDDGRTLTGLISAETATSVTLKRAEGATDSILRVNLEELRSTGLSIMPEGLEKQLDQQTLADVIAYLLALQ